MSVITPHSHCCVVSSSTEICLQHGNELCGRISFPVYIKKKTDGKQSSVIKVVKVELF